MVNEELKPYMDKVHDELDGVQFESEEERYRAEEEMFSKLLDEAGIEISWNSNFLEMSQDPNNWINPTE